LEKKVVTPEIVSQQSGTPMVRNLVGSKLKKWSCGCATPVNARIAIDDFHAQCLKCRRLFARQDGQMSAENVSKAIRRKMWLEWAASLCRLASHAAEQKNEIISLLRDMTGLSTRETLELVEEALALAAPSGT